MDHTQLDILFHPSLKVNVWVCESKQILDTVRFGPLDD